MPQAARNRPGGAGAGQATDPAQLEPGTVIVHTYGIERFLGGGGMGRVYLARHLELNSLHALKVIRDDLLQDARTRDLFQREATVLRSLRHEAVVAYEGFFRDEQGRTLLVMEYVDGQSLAERVATAPLSVDELFLLRDRIGAGLTFAHEHGAIHRDISPDNIILPDGDIARAVLIDFGLSKRSDADATTILGQDFAGKLRYASPEQLGLFDQAVDQRSDLYSFGLTLVTAALGKPLRGGATLTEVMRMAREAPALEQLPQPVRPMLEAMLKPQPAQRPASLRDVMMRWPGPAAGSARVSKPGKGNRKIQVAAAALGVLLLGAIPAGIMLWQDRRAMDGSADTADPASAASSALAERSAPAAERSGAAPRRTEPGAASGVAKTAPGAGAKPADGDAGEPTYGEVVGRIRRLRGDGRLADAFTLVQSLRKEGLPLPRQEVYELSVALRASGSLDRGFALTRQLAHDGDAKAAFDLGEMYDPQLWSAEQSPFSKPNRDKALEWYRRAQERGVAAATERVVRLETEQ